MNISKVRKPVREVLAIAIWAHALFATEILGVPSVRWAAVPGYAYDLSLVGFILFYSFCCDSGWLSVLFDLFYAYLWPFIWTFRLTFFIGKYAWRKAGEHDIIPGNIKQIEIDTKKAISDGKVAAPPQQVKGPSLMLAIRSMGHFGLIWCLVILNTKSNVLAGLAIFFALFGAVMATYGIWGFISGALDFITGLKGNVAKQMSDACQTILDWDESMGVDRIRNTAGLVFFFGKVCSFFADKKTKVARIASFIALTITVPFYLYVSSIFACVYLGLARIQHLTLDWKSALTDSLFMPIAFTDMPHGLLIRLIAGVQAVVIGAMGYNVIFRHFNSKVEAIAIAANELRQPLAERQLVQRLVLINASTADKKPPMQVIEQPRSLTGTD